MPGRHFPVRPDLDQLKHQAKDLLRSIRGDDPAAIEELRELHPKRIEPGAAKLADAQLVLARSYGLPSWPRLVLACRMTDAIWRDDAGAVRDLVAKHPRLLDEDARGVKGNWGPPMSYAANLGRDRIIAMLRGLGAADLQLAFDRACLQGRLETARQLYGMGARPALDAVMGPAETQSGSGLEFLLGLGAAISDKSGDRLAPVAMVLQTYCRNPEGKHRCLELFAEHGIDLPDTPPMAVHRGRIDLLEEHLRRDPGLLARTFSHEEIYPPELGCHADKSLALHGTPLAGATLLHLCVDNDEIEITRRLLERGADANARAEVDADGFGGHTPLFGCVVSQPYRVGLRTDDAFARLLLDHGADPNARATLRKRLRFIEDESMHEYPDVTPLAWGRRFHDQAWVSRPVMRLITERGGQDQGPARQNVGSP
ncbi:MAG TPA: ankyrin repeat domain-containing protein [Thermoanaerobaculia bacterium]|nr:ankyrin repeat domain-containing protein [Thermoanaerobaculia bacterium]